MGKNMVTSSLKILATVMVITTLNSGIIYVNADEGWMIERKTCTSDYHCAKTAMCEFNKCVDACSGKKCNDNERCIPGARHKGICICQPGYIRKFSNCEKSCVSDSTCNTNQICYTEGLNFRYCKCIQPDYIADPYFPDTCRLRCQNDDDCGESSLCKMEMCFDFCDETKCPFSSEKCLNLGKSFQCLNTTIISNLYDCE